MLHLDVSAMSMQVVVAARVPEEPYRGIPLVRNDGLVGVTGAEKVQGATKCSPGVALPVPGDAQGMRSLHENVPVGSHRSSSRTRAGAGFRQLGLNQRRSRCSRVPFSDCFPYPPLRCFFPEYHGAHRHP